MGAPHQLSGLACAVRVQGPCVGRALQTHSSTPRWRPFQSVPAAAFTLSLRTPIPPAGLASCRAGREATSHLHCEHSLINISFFHFVF